MSRNTTDSYKVGFQQFELFRQNHGLVIIWPPPVEHISLFLAYLSLQGYSHNTARLYLSALSFHCKINSYIDVTKHFIISKVLEGMRRAARIRLPRLPITFNLLRSIVSKLGAVCFNDYERCLFCTAFTLAFFGFFRVGEITVTKHVYLKNVITIDDIRLDEGNKSLSVHVRFSKTDQTGKGVWLKLVKSGTDVCPVLSMISFLRVRPPVKGPLFCHFNLQPLTRYQFSAVLRKTLSVLNINYTQYKAHSFRIGAATTAANLGIPVETIKSAGRWKSSVYQNYIRSADALPMPGLVSF